MYALRSSGDNLFAGVDITGEWAFGVDGVVGAGILINYAEAVGESCLLC